MWHFYRLDIDKFEVEVGLELGGEGGSVDDLRQVDKAAERRLN